MSRPSSPRTVAGPSVRFSEMSRMVLFDTFPSSSSSPEERTSSSSSSTKLLLAQFYSPQELTRIRLQLIRDARRMMTLAAANNITQDELDECIGIERMLSADIARRIAQHKTNHIRSIVSRQGTCTPKELCEMSQASSRFSCEMAERLAASIVAVRESASDDSAAAPVAP